MSTLDRIVYIQYSIICVELISCSNFLNSYKKGTYMSGLSDSWHMRQSFGMEVAFQRLGPRLTRAAITARPHIGKEKSFWVVRCPSCNQEHQVGEGEFVISLCIPSKPISGFLLGTPLVCCGSNIMVPAIFLRRHINVAQALVEAINDSPYGYSERVWVPL